MIYDFHHKYLTEKLIIYINQLHNTDVMLQKKLSAIQKLAA